MILMGDLPFRVAFENSTQCSRKCQFILIFVRHDLLARAGGGKSTAP